MIYVRISPAVIVLVIFTGCFPGVRVIKNPGPRDPGIRYYRPKPYLLLKPVVEGEFSDQHVEISMEYLPDFSEEYSIRVRPGLGTANVDIKLNNGWNLTQISQELDSPTGEIISAVGKALGEAAKLAQGGGGGTARFIVKASNVPLGYYEAVIAKDPCGQKQLYGWRYLGFLPYRQCPVKGSGGDCFSCNEVPTPVFALVYENGTLAFKQIDHIEETASETAAFALPEDPPNMLRLPQIFENDRSDGSHEVVPARVTSG